MRIAFVYAPGRRARLDATRAGHGAREFYYGALEFERRGYEVGILEPGKVDPRRLACRALTALFRWQLLPARTTGDVLLALDALRGTVNTYDVVVGTTTPTAYGLAALRIAGRIRPPVVGIQCGLVNYVHSRRRRAVNGFVLRRSWTQLFGEGELNAVRELFGVPAARVEVNQFGVDTAFWSPGGTEGGYVLSVGNDARRDYELLAATAARCSHRFKVVTARPRPDSLPANVEWLRGDWHAQALSDRELRDLYRGAALVAIPLKDSLQPSGQSVCLQAMACGKPVVLTDTRGLWSREMMRDGENVLLVPPGDGDALLRTIQRLMEDAGERERIGRHARETACAEGNIEGFAERLEALCCRALAS